MLLPSDPYELNFNECRADGSKIWSDENMENIKLNSYGKEADEPQFTEYESHCNLCGEMNRVIIGWGICSHCYDDKTDKNGDGIDQIDGSDIQRAAIESVCGADIETDMER